MSKKREQEKRFKKRKEIKSQIEKVYENNPDFLDVMADYLADPNFDYEFEGRGVDIEDREGPMPGPQITKSIYVETYKPKTKFGKIFLRDSHQRVLAAMLVVMVGIMGWYGYYWKTIVSKAILTKAYVYGKEVDFKQIPGTVRENLEFNGILYDADDETKPSLNTKVDENTTIRIDEVHYATVQKKEKVISQDYIMLDPMYPSGVRVETKGNDGEGVFLYKTKIVNNEVKSSEKRRIRWVVKARDHIIHLGTMRTGHRAKCKISKTFTANCSAYWMGNNCVGAGGGRCVYGTVAVDRFRYPYGTQFWIEGYGYAVANDCGSSIKGDKLDLWMDSYAESCRWGRRHMTTYVLTDVQK